MTTEPVRVLNLFTIMNRGGAETMVMNYYRNIDRSKVQYDFMVHRQERAPGLPGSTGRRCGRFTQSIPSTG